MNTKLLLAAAGLLALSAIPTQAIARDHGHRSGGYYRGHYHVAPVYRSGYVVRDYGYGHGYYAPRYSYRYRGDRCGYDSHRRHHHHRRHGLRIFFGGLFR